MDLLGVAAMANMPACAAFLRSTAADITAAKSESVAPSRIASLRLTSFAPKRHTCIGVIGVGVKDIATRCARHLIGPCKAVLASSAESAELGNILACSKGTRSGTTSRLHTCDQISEPTFEKLEGEQWRIPLSSYCTCLCWGLRTVFGMLRSNYKASSCGHLQVAISHEPQAIAVAAEGLSHARHKADCAGKAWNAEVLCDLTTWVLQCSSAPGWTNHIMAGHNSAWHTVTI